MNRRNFIQDIAIGTSAMIFAPQLIKVPWKTATRFPVELWVHQKDLFIPTNILTVLLPRRPNRQELLDLYNKFKPESKPEYTENAVKWAIDSLGPIKGQLSFRYKEPSELSRLSYE